MPAEDERDSLARLKSGGLGQALARMIDGADPPDCALEAHPPSEDWRVNLVHYASRMGQKNHPIALLRKLPHYGREVNLSPGIVLDAHNPPAVAKVGDLVLKNYNSRAR
jgi:hypothetical protein